ncbi:MAG: nitrilase-related carbon-nitrogen hydrolase [Steroidobacteraceae bacterium]
MIEPYNVTVVQPRTRPVFRADGVFRRDVLRENLEHCCELIHQGHRAYRSRLFVLPEFCLHGFEIGVPTPAWIESSVRLPGPESERLAQVARATGAYVAGMVYEIIDEFPGRYFNTAFIISPGGEIVLRYRKLYSLTGKTSPVDVYDQYVRLHGGPESLFPVVDTPLGRLGALVCYDINYPEVARCLALRGAEVLLHITSEARGPEQAADGGWTVARRARAWENVCYLAMADSGPQVDTDLPPNVCHGHSQVIDYTGRVLHMAEGGEECMITAEIDIEALRRRRTGRRYNFLTELCAQAHAPIYAAAQAFPINGFAAAPMPDVADNHARHAAVVAAMQSQGVLVPPARGRSA